MYAHRQSVQLSSYFSPNIIINRMFILANIKVNTSEVLFFPDNRKFLKFQISTPSLTQTKAPKSTPFPANSSLPMKYTGTHS